MRCLKLAFNDKVEQLGKLVADGRLGQRCQAGNSIFAKLKHHFESIVDAAVVACECLYEAYFLVAEAVFCQQGTYMGVAGG